LPCASSGRSWSEHFVEFVKPRSRLPIRVSVDGILTGVLVTVCLGTALATLARAALRSEDRPAWLLLGLALLANAVGRVLLVRVGALYGVRHFPSLADPFLLAYFPLAFGAGMLLARDRLAHMGAMLWFDGAVGALGAAAIVAQLLIEPVREVTGGGLALAIALAYPMGNVLMVALAVVALSTFGWRMGGTRWLLAAAIVLRAANDALYIWTRAHASEPRSAIAVLALATMACFAIAAWRPVSRRREIEPGGAGLLVAPGVLAVVALGLLVLDHFVRSGAVPVFLSAATLLAAMARGALALRENLRLLATRRQAVTDELTGLPNRRQFYARLTAAVEQGPQPLAVAMVDLDRFKELNDTLGHHAGDLLLAQLGPRLREVVGDAGFVARLGGDEFALLLPGAGLARASEIGRKVGAALQQPFVIDGLEVVMDASVGAALCPQHGREAEGLLQRADVAMYQAKQARTGFQVYEPARDRHSRERLALMAELRRALERNELVLHYQPKVDLASGRVAGVEALVRWQHPVHGMRGPGAFLPHAEHTALMRPLTLHVLSTALSDLARWRGEGLDLTVAVNLAVQNLLDLRTPAHVGELLAANGLTPSVLTLEVTESLLLHDPQRAGEVLRDLREMGIGLALDDFGTGYSSLEHLKRLPVDELKIDKSFVMTMDRDPADRAIVASTAALGRALGLRVVAEGVESAAAASVVTAIGCDMAQGFHYSPPVPAGQLPGVVQAPVGVADLAASADRARRPSPPAGATPRPAM
jgi:diguanylate cyclase